MSFYSSHFVQIFTFKCTWQRIRSWIIISFKILHGWQQLLIDQWSVCFSPDTMRVTVERRSSPHWRLANVIFYSLFLFPLSLLRVHILVSRSLFTSSLISRFLASTSFLRAAGQCHLFCFSFPIILTSNHILADMASSLSLFYIFFFSSISTHF